MLVLGGRFPSYWCGPYGRDYSSKYVSSEDIIRSCDVSSGKWSASDSNFRMPFRIRDFGRAMTSDSKFVIVVAMNCLNKIIVYILDMDTRQWYEAHTNINSLISGSHKYQQFGHVFVVGHRLDMIDTIVSGFIRHSYSSAPPELLALIASFNDEATVHLVCFSNFIIGQ